MFKILGKKNKNSQNKDILHFFQWKKKVGNSIKKLLNFIFTGGDIFKLYGKLLGDSKSPMFSIRFHPFKNFCKVSSNVNKTR